METELTLLNNNIQTVSGAINSYSTNCAGSTTKYIVKLLIKILVNSLMVLFAILILQDMEMYSKTRTILLEQVK